jgi:hypothetical protein
VGHRRWLFDEALNTAETLGECEDLGFAHHVGGLFEACVHLEADHPAEVVHLRGREVVVRVRFEAGVVDAVHGLVVLQPVGECAGVLAVAVHPDREGLSASEDEEALVRAGSRAHAVLVETELLVQFLVVSNQCSANHVGVAAHVLRQRVGYEVCTKFERSLEVGRGEGVVHRAECVVVVGDVRGARDIHDVEQGVGRCLDPDQLS